MTLCRFILCNTFALTASVCVVGCDYQNISNAPSSETTSANFNFPPPVEDATQSAIPIGPTENTAKLAAPERTRETAPVLTPESHGKFFRGMSILEAAAIFAIAPEKVGGDGKDTIIYRWEDVEGNYFTARFELGLLTMQSGLRQRRVTGVPAPLTSPPIQIGGGPVAEVAPGVFVPLERAIASSVGQPLGVAVPSMPFVDQEQPIQNYVAEKKDPTVVVAGGTRRARESVVTGDSERSYTPQAKLPDFGHTLHKGRYEIRLLNPTEGLITVGLRKDKRGQDLTVPPNGQASLKVDRGVYALYFLREDDPEALFEAESIAIDGIRTTDVEVHLNPDDVEVRQIDYGVPE